MKKIGLIWLAGCCVALAPARLAAQSDDPSEVFLKAYMTSQQGEKLEHDNQLQAALSKFRFAGSLLEQLKKPHADWQPAIVDYRSRKIAENIIRVQGKVGNQKDLAATSNPPPAPSNAPSLPTTPGPPEPNVVVTKSSPLPPQAPAPPATEARAAVLVNDAAIKDATKKLQDKVDQLQAELEKSRTQYDAVAKEKESLNGKLQETSTKLEQAQKEIEKTKGAQQEARTQLAQAEDSLKKIAGSDKQDSKKQEALRGEIAQLKKALAAAEKERAAAEKEKDTESAKVTAVTKERNQLLAELRTANQARERVQVLVTENTELKTKLAIAEKTVREIGADKPKKEQEIAEVKRQVEQLRQPVVAVSDVNPASSQGTFAMAKNGPNKPPTGPTVQTTAPAVPDELAPLARDAKDNFEKGKYRAAERQYQELLTKAPNNLYSLSNLGVVYFRTGKWKAAELTLKKAVALAPKDEFAHTTLGIVYYRQSKFDEAITELTTALGINPKSATAHNYLGITASQKGWQEAAEKEMLDAIAVNPDYADAHFNLAVVYATGQPPAKEQAKLHYVKATSLGAEPDPALEKLLR